jgi:transposase
MPRSTILAVATVNTVHMIGRPRFPQRHRVARVSRGRISSRLANLPPCLIGIEAGMATHYLLANLPRWATM